MTEPLPLTRDAALERWQVFLPKVRQYGTRRNFVSASHVEVSQLSPALRFGLIRPEEIVRETLMRHELRAVEKWVQEVCWRSYWKGWLEMRPQVWRAWRQRVHELRTNLPDEVLVRANEVSEGRSGVAIMDHFARELRQTGYLHNHARMWWASFWIHAERLPWELGAEFFFQQLLDADPASNTLSWRWVAGLQTAGKSYLVRRSNLERYCEASLLADTGGMERLEDGRVMPCPVTDPGNMTRQTLPPLPTSLSTIPGRVGLWIHPEDLCVETSPLSTQQPVSIAAFTSDGVYAHYGLSERRKASLHTVLHDGLTRAGSHFGVPTTLADASTTAAGIAAWVEAERLDAIMAMSPTVGPVADAMPAIRAELAKRKVALHLVRRAWDSQHFEAAKSGFFPFWEKTSRALKQEL